VAEQFPMLAKKLGESFFNDKLNTICLDWLKDPIFSIREVAIINIKELCIIFGPQWSLKHVLPPLMDLHKELNYLHRMTPLFAISKLAPIFPAEIIRS
jgi:serine/threonine-protein phosphatase 2A regulatory subunit A